MSVRARVAGAQIALDLPAPSRVYRAENYVVSQSNEQQAAFVRRFADGPEPALAICGPRGSGKTHLLHVAAGDAVFAAADPGRSGEGREPLIALDDAHRIDDPRAFLALLEARRRKGAKTIVAGAGAPGSWAVGLRDLETRLEALPRATLDEPDEALLTAVLRQQFRQRQLVIGARVVAFAAPRLPKTFAAAGAFVEAAAREAHAGGQPINLALARKIVEHLSEGVCEA